MPTWLISALSLLPRLRGPAGTALAITGAGTALEAISGGRIDVPFIGSGAVAPTRRRRRKRIFTAQDRADIAFIAATLGRQAAKEIAAIAAAK